MPSRWTTVRVRGHVRPPFRPAQRGGLRFVLRHSTHESAGRCGLDLNTTRRRYRSQDEAGRRESGGRPESPSAAALAHHFREAEGRSIAQITRRLSRSPATVKAYFYDPTDANKGLSRERVAKAGGREVWSHLPAAAARGEIQPGRTLLSLDWAVQHVR